MIISILLAILTGAIYSLFGYLYISLDEDVNAYKPWRIFVAWLFWPFIFLFTFMGAIGAFVLMLSAMIYIFILTVAELIGKAVSFLINKFVE